MKSIPAPTLPPGPRSVIPFRYLRVLQRDPIPFLSGVAREFGGLVTWWRIKRDLHLRLGYDSLVKGSATAERFFSEEGDLLKKLSSRERAT
jgi:hypothetical protein